MGQSAKEEADLAMWNAVRDELPRLGVTRDGGMDIGEVAQAIARSRGFGPEKVMGGLLDAVRRGELELDGKTVRCR
jgi:hypothetical protein